MEETYNKKIELENAKKEALSKVKTLKEYVEYERIQKEFKDVETQFKTELSSIDTNKQFDTFKVFVSWEEKSTFDMQLFKEECPEIYEKYLRKDMVAKHRVTKVKNVQ
jgi:predicted phage-related endonuclease